jgi:hypothetical protein
MVLPPLLSVTSPGILMDFNDMDAGPDAVIGLVQITSNASARTNFISYTLDVY